jgi:hypothetical protein
MTDEQIGNPALEPHEPTEGEEACPACEAGGRRVALVRFTRTASLYDPATDPEQPLIRWCPACAWHHDALPASLL